MLQEEESFPNLTELVLLKDTWAIIRAQVNTNIRWQRINKTHFNPLMCDMFVKVTQLTMETFQQLFALNSDMSHYLPEASGEELHNTTQVPEFSCVTPKS